MSIVVVFPMFFIFFFGAGTSSKEESIFFFTDENIISEAVESQKEHDGSWLDYIAAIFTIGDFNPDKIKEVDADLVASNISDGSYEELLGDKKASYEQAREYFSFIYKDLASVETRLRKYIIDQEGTEIFVEVKETKYHGFYPIAHGYEHIIYNDYGLETSRTDNLGNNITADKDTPIINCISGVVTNVEEDFWGFKSITIRDNANRDWVYIDVGSLEVNLSIGSQVEAGDILGYFGNRELFIKIGVNYQKTDTIWINPYGILAFLKDNRTYYWEN